MKEDFEKQEYSRDTEGGGNTWTSNSDLFMVMAIIFLFLFVFTLLKSSMVTLQSKAKIKEIVEYQKGKVPVSKKEKIKSVRNILDSGLRKLERQESVIGQKVDQMNRFKEGISNYQQDMKKFKQEISGYQKEMNNLISEFETQQAMLVSTNEIIQKQEKMIFKKEEELASLKNMKVLLSKKLLVNKESQEKMAMGFTKKNEALANKLEEKDSSIKKMKNQIKSRNELIREKEAKIKAIKKKENKYSLDLKKVIKENKQHKENISKLNKDKSELKSKIKEKLHKNLSILQEIASKDEQISHLNQEINNLNKSYDQNTKFSKELSAKLAAMNQAIDGKQKELDGLNNLNKSLSGKLNKMEQELASVNNSLQQYRTPLGGASGEQGEGGHGASLGHLRTLKANIGQSIADKFSKKGIPVEVDPSTGTIVLSMDDTFEFKNNSFVLSDNAKMKLERVMPIYLETLFGRAEIAEIIQSVQIVGHASPRYKYEYFDPEVGTDEAYNYNMSLSLNRARTIAEYLISEDFNALPHKQIFKRKLEIFGKSHVAPILIAKGEIKEACGKWDCGRSRRVEISFQLKDVALSREVKNKINGL